MGFLCQVICVTQTLCTFVYNGSYYSLILLVHSVKSKKYILNVFIINLFIFVTVSKGITNVIFFVGIINMLSQLNHS